MPEWLSNLLGAVNNLLVFTYDIIFQAWTMRHLPKHIDGVGGTVKGLTAIVTGPTSGIGEETAAALARRGAKVVLACRSVERGKQVAAALAAAAAAAGQPAPSVEVRVLDLASLASVRAFGAAWEAEGRALHLLINNAGVFGIGAPRAETADGFELHLGSNHLGHYLLTLMLLPSLRRGAAQLAAAAAPGAASGGKAAGEVAGEVAAAAAAGASCRIVNVSSSYHSLARAGVSVTDPHLRRRGTYNADLAYAQSKLANILFTRELRRRLAASDPALAPGALALHPGLICSGVARGLHPALQWAYHAIMGRILLNCMQGARANIHAATSPTAPAEAAATEGYFNANCLPLLPSPAARDDVAATWLWRWSAEQVSLPKELDLPEPN